MRVINIQTKYEPRIWLDDGTKTILKIDCSCWNFVNKQIKKVGKVHDTKYTANPCKHLKEWVDTLLKQGFKMKEIKPTGSDKLTADIKRGVLEVWGNKCFYNDCPETNNLQIHRLNRGHLGGKYSILNCRPFCPKHHKLMHSREFI